jgi:hypothetical protein
MVRDRGTFLITRIIVCRYMNSPLTRELDKYEDGDFVAHYAEEHSLDKYRELASRLAAMDLV